MKSGVTFLGAAERDVRGLAERPVPAAMILQPLLGAESVDRQLQRARLVGRRRQLVVDQPERAVLEQVESIGDARAAQSVAVATRADELELAAKLYSSSRSTTSAGRSASMRNTTSPRPAATGEPSSLVRSSAASASGSVFSSLLDDVREQRHGPRRDSPP